MALKLYWWYEQIFSFFFFFYYEVEVLFESTDIRISGEMEEPDSWLFQILKNSHWWFGKNNPGAMITESEST